jgi:hypothetical protein
MASADDEIQQPLRTMQIIAVALPAGVVFFLAVVGFLVMRDGPAPNRAGQLPIVTIIAFVMLAADTAMALIAPRQMIAAGLERIAQSRISSDVKQLLALRQTSLIVTLALFEGPAFVGCVALLIERELYATAVPILALVGMFLNFPTETSVHTWLARYRQQVLDLRQAGGA